ncbi:MAG: hypothetical protein HY882_04735 [Deltaproteobacteria bacterium]|nr:hypothetical protein [Deltaproteobacteria bacterium]
MRKYLSSTLLILIFSFSLWAQSPALNSDQSIALVFSSNVHGEVEPCG